MKNLNTLFRCNFKFYLNINKQLSHKNLYFNQCRGFLLSNNVHRSFFERDSRDSEIYSFPGDKGVLFHVKEGRKLFIEQSKLFVEEVKERFQDMKLYKDGDTDVFFRFDSEDCLKKWRVTSDKKNKMGNSECDFIINDKNKAVFFGNIDTTPPKDGKHRFTGFCGIKSLKKMKAFYRDDRYDWSSFTHLELRVKGDGRNYMVNIGLALYFDITWFSTYTYTMHTRGGPYWEVIRIPFSKFIYTSKGRVQDNQQPPPLDRIQNVGITSAAVSGPFRLEIDYIGCHKDDSHKEKSAYELYMLPKEYVSD